MGFIDALFSTRAVDASQFPIADNLFTSVTDSGENVSTASAMRLVSVYACVTFIADAIRALPVDVFRRQGDTRVPVSSQPRWLSQPNQEQTWGPFIDLVLHSMLVHGNSFVWLPSRDNLGFPERLHLIHPDDVEVRTDRGKKIIVANGTEVPEYNAGNPAGQVLHTLAHSADGIVGLSPIDQAKQAIGSGLALEKFGNKFFGQGAVPSATVEMPPGSVPTGDQLKALAAEFKKKHSGTDNAWKPIVLANGASYKPITIPNDQAQFIESQKFSVAQIARLYRIPPHLIGDVERSTSWGSGIEEQNIGFVIYTLLPWLTRIEESLSQLLPRGQFVKFNVEGLLRGDQESRVAFYEGMARTKAITINEIRALEDLPPLPDGDQPPPAPNESI